MKIMYSKSLTEECKYLNDFWLIENHLVMKSFELVICVTICTIFYENMIYNMIININIMIINAKKFICYFSG